ncbi:MAG: hypothetical protein V4563_03520 [Pseudomonadota bacterium]
MFGINNAIANEGAPPADEFLEIENLVRGVCKKDGGVRTNHLVTGTLGSH